MKKLLLTAVASLVVAMSTLVAATITADPYGFAPAKSLVGCSVAVYVDTGQDASAIASIQKTKINAVSTAKVDRKFAAPALYAEYKGDLLSPLMAHRFASDSLKFAANGDRPWKVEVGWIEAQSKIDSKQTI